MLHHSNLFPSFWAEAISFACFILNRAPTKALGTLTPEEVWTRMKSSLQDIRVFGYCAYSLDQRTSRRKLDSRSIPCIYLGPSINSPGHRLYNITTKRVIISRNVLFDELTLSLPEDTPQQHQHDVAQLQVGWTLPTALPYIQLPGIQPVAASEVQDFTNLDWEDDIISANTPTTTVDIPSDPREDSNEIPAL